MRTVAIIDIGKTNVKLALVDTARAAEVAVETTPNRVVPGPPWPHFDTGAQWDFIRAALRRLARDARIDGIAVTTHGACAALLAADGTLAAPVMDYEHTGPDDLRAEYDTLRPPFAETGSPRLPMGLNLGAQLHWQLRQDRDLAARTAQVVTWPQYWAHRLTGIAACDLSSLGCHTDLWNPHAGTWSALPARLGLEGRMAPPRKPGDILGTLLPEIQTETGIGPVPVLCGIHDSNASLLPHLLQRKAPFAVVSTGTWVISMAIGGTAPPLDPARDTLVNVAATGQPVPSARFMGGREYDLIRAPGSTATPQDEAQVIASELLLLPSVVADSGPFPGRAHRWTADPPTPGQREAALSFYLALMAATGLATIGAQGPTVVEGPFAANGPFLRMLATATGRPVLPSAARTGTAVGTAMLFGPPQETQPDAPVLPQSGPAAAYAAAWAAAATA